MALSPDIITKRLKITPFSEQHLGERYIGWLNSQELMKYSEQRHKKHTMESCRQYWQSFDGTPNYFWAIEETDRGLGHIGNINAYVDVHNSIADLGIIIGEKDVQAQGYGLEAWIGVSEFLFLKRHIRKITAGAMAINTLMIKLMKKAGMQDWDKKGYNELLTQITKMEANSKK